MNKTILIFLIAIVVIGGAYWFSTQTPAGYETPIETVDGGNNNNGDVVIKGPLGVARDASGQYLTDKSGMTLYVNVKDQNPAGTIKASCNTACEATWRPFLLADNEAAPSASSDSLLSRLNLFKRADGKYQYTLGTNPLYLNVNNKVKGDAMGVGGDWIVATP